MSFRHFLGFLTLFALLPPAAAAPPAWWATGNPPIITGTEANNRAPANIGQAKWMVNEALRTLDTAAPTLALQIRADLAGTAPDFTNRILDLTVPNPKSPSWLAAQKSPLLLGQLKAISAPFYTCLDAAYPTWLTTERTTNATNLPNSIFPWTTTPDDDQNKSTATLGQLKAVFSLRFETLPSLSPDTDGDGLTDAQELQLGSDPYLDDTNGDGVDDATAYASGKNPADPGPDTDGDGVPDGARYSVQFKTTNQHREGETGFQVTGRGEISGKNREDLNDLYRYLTLQTYIFSELQGGPPSRNYKSEVTDTSTYFKDDVPCGKSQTTHKVTPESNVFPREQVLIPGYRSGESQTSKGPIIDSPTEYSYSYMRTDEWRIYPSSEWQTSSYKYMYSSKVTDRFTFQEMWKNHFKKIPWIKDPSYIYSKRYDTSGREFGSGYEFGADPLLQNRTMSWVSKGRNKMEEHDLESLSWRWIRFNPFKPSGFDYAAPPATYNKQCNFIVYQDDNSERKVKGSFKLDFNGSAGAGWHTVEPSLYNIYKVDNPPNLSTSNFSDKSENSTVTFTNVVLAPAVDANRDGQITFDGRDKTTTEKPYRFWINDDRDIEHTVDQIVHFPGDKEEDDVNSDEQAEPDCDVPRLKFRRDLEDLTRISVNIVGVSNLFLGNDSAVALKVRIDADMGTPKVNLFKAVETEGGMEFLKDEATGYNQLQGNYGQELCKVTGSSSVEVPRWTWEYLYGIQKLNLLFEGVAEGNGKLVFEVWKDGAKVYELPPIHLMLRKAKAFYETWTVGDSTESTNFIQSNDYSTWPKPSAQWELGTGSALVPPVKPEEKDYIMFVHGWNMSPVDKTQFADTMYKRHYRPTA